MCNQANVGHILSLYTLENKLKPIRPIFENLTKRCDKFVHYFPLYEKWFENYVDRAPRILEIGVRGGGSLQMWKKYFGEGTYVHGVDIDPKCINHADPDNNIHVTIGDGSDRVFWEQEFKAKGIREFDIIIDDGSHDNPDQINTLKWTYELLKDQGIYWCEDTHTSYYTNREDGGLKSKNSFTSYTKRIVDVLSREHTHFAIGHGELDGPHVPEGLINLYSQLQGVHFYDSVIVLEKGTPFNFKRIVKKG